jgi:MerR family transcriptional regulator, light-induced transcriptional regulator
MFRVDAGSLVRFNEFGGSALVSCSSLTSQIPEFIEQFLTMQLAGDRTGALRVIETALKSGRSIPDIYLGLIQPAQYEIGVRWERDEISVADEHVATAIAHLALDRIYGFRDEIDTHGPRLIVGCVEGEMHDVGARIVADLCELRGFDVTFLGANVPTDSVLRIIDCIRPDAVLLSATMTWNVPTMINAVQMIESEGVRVVCGGQALRWLEPDVVQPHSNLVANGPLETIELLEGQLAYVIEH